MLLGGQCLFSAEKNFLMYYIIFLMGRRRFLRDSVIVSFRLPSELRDLLKVKGEEVGLKPSELFRRVLEAYLKGEDRVVVVRKEVRVEPDRYPGFGVIDSWEKGLEAAAMVAERAYRVAQALLDADERELAAQYMSVVLKGLRIAMQAKEKADLDEFRRRLSKLEENLGGG